MDPQSGLTLFNAIAAAGKTIFEIAQGTSKLETKQQLMDVYDTLMNLKRETATLEDVNRELKEKLRFKGDSFEFKNPFYYEKQYPDRPLCAKCFANEKIAPMGEPFQGMSGNTYRNCLVCRNSVECGRSTSHNSPASSSGPSGPNSWMR